MIETIIREYLKTAQSLPVVLVRSPGMEKFYLIQKTGSRTVNKITWATLAIQSYAPSKYEAAQMNQDLISLMDKAVALNEISSVELNSDYDFTDTTTKEERYQAIFEIVHY